MKITKELASAVVMTMIIAFFTYQIKGDWDESTGMAPVSLLFLMGAFNVGQYVLGFIRWRNGIDTVLSLEGYPLRRVSVLLALTVAFIALADQLGFYLASFVYFLVASLVAQPMPITGTLVARRATIVLVCVVFLYLLFTVALNVQIPKGILGL